MNIKYFGLVLLMTFFILWIGCSGKGADKIQVDHSRYQMDEKNKEQVIKNLPKVKLGDDRLHVIELLGTPTDDAGIADKKTGQTMLKVVDYYFSMEDRAVVKETDPNLTLYFTKTDKLYDANTNAGLSIDHIKAKKK
jgi:hypothetical protein